MALHCAGAALGLGGLVAVAFRLHGYTSEIALQHFEPRLWVLLGALATAYGAATILLALAWRDLLAFLGVGTPRLWAVRTYGLSQLAKYMPGNVFHLAGRQAFGVAAGLPGWVLAKSAAWELGLISTAGILFSPLAWPLLWKDISPLLAIVLFAGVIMMATVAINLRFGNHVARAMYLQILFLLVSGMIFVCILRALSSYQAPLSLLLPMGGTYVIAWLAGLVTPGAPAGVGVREVVLLFLLRGWVAESPLLMAVVLGRIVTVGGDLAFFLAATIARKKQVNEGY